jgi:hypothetical protein
LNEDLLKGAAEIGAFIRRTPRAAYHLLEARRLPAFKIGGVWSARKSTLTQLFAGLEQQHQKPATPDADNRPAPENPPRPRGPGRPRGAKNRPKVSSSNQTILDAG